MEASMTKPFINLDQEKDTNIKMEPYKPKARYLIENFSTKFWRFDPTSPMYQIIESRLAYTLYLCVAKPFEGIEQYRIESIAQILNCTPAELTSGVALPF